MPRASAIGTHAGLNMKGSDDMTCVNGIIGTEGMVGLEPVTPNPKASDMTMLDHFAGLAMQAYINTDPNMMHDDEDMAQMAYAAADAMMKERLE